MISQLIEWPVTRAISVIAAASLVILTVVILTEDSNSEIEQEEPTPTTYYESSIARYTPMATKTTMPTATMTFLPTSTPVPVVPQIIVEAPEAPVYSGEAYGDYIVTYYDQCCVGGPFYCGVEIYGYFNPLDPTTVATGWGGFTCGTHLLLCSNVCISVVVKDLCSGCGSNHLDLSRGAYNALGGPTSVRVEVI